ncbi:MAG: lactate racemase domain-containing protein, partial [Bryobacteraceae bacterium]
MSLFFGAGSETTEFSSIDLRQSLFQALDALGPRRKVLCLPPDFTRFHSRAGEITEIVWQYYGDRLTDILPAIGTHTPMTGQQIARMFGKTPADRFRVHDWRNGIVTLGEVPAAFICGQSEGKLNFSWPAQVDRLLVEGDFDLILSIGQVVPHEVIGMANHNKNVFVGTGGADGINKSHYLGAVYGMERMMGRADTPVRRVLNYASDHFARHLPIVYIQTVIAKNEAGELA